MGGVKEGWWETERGKHWEREFQGRLWLEHSSERRGKGSAHWRTHSGNPLRAAAGLKREEASPGNKRNEYILAKIRLLVVGRSLSAD